MRVCLYFMPLMVKQDAIQYHGVEFRTDLLVLLISMNVLVLLIRGAIPFSPHYFGLVCRWFSLSVPVQVIAWVTVSEMTYHVSSGMLNPTHSLTVLLLKVKGCVQLFVGTHLRAAERHLPHCHLPPDTGERAPPEPQPCRPALDSPTAEGWKAELTLVVGDIPRWLTCPQTVTHPVM